MMVVAAEQPTAMRSDLFVPVIDAPRAFTLALDATGAIETVARAATRLGSIAARSIGSDGRTSCRLWGREISVPELLRRAAHEGNHHLNEIELLLAGAAPFRPVGVMRSAPASAGMSGQR